MSARVRALGAVLLALAACKTGLFSSDDDLASLAVVVVEPAHAALKAPPEVTSVSITLTGPRSMTRTASPGETVRIDELPEGRYTVRLEGFAGSTLIWEGQDDVDVTAGRAARAVIAIRFVVPRVTISQPSPGTTVTSADMVTLTASASDDDDGDLTAEITWTSDLDGPLGTGGTVTPMLTPGEHTVIASVRDSQNNLGADTVAVTVLSPPPVVTITEPSQDTTVTLGDMMTLNATATDDDDGDLTASITWTSDIDGPLADGGTVTLVLSQGVHTIVASVQDSENQNGADTVSVAADGPPTVTITQPSPDTTVTEGDMVTLTAGATDVVDGDLTASIDWTSDIDGPLGSGGTLTPTLTRGLHTIIASVQDSQSQTGADTVRVFVDGPPTVTITEPSQDTTVILGDPLSLTATATDAEDGEVTASIAWTSDIDGPLGSGGAVTPTLTQGVHTIIASVQDSRDQAGADTVSVTVQGQLPIVTITEPSRDTIVTWGDPITLSAVASDDNGDLTDSIRWSSDVDGLLGGGGTVMPVLSQGAHTIVASVQNSQAQTGADTVFVATTPSPDINGDGWVGICDLDLMLSAWGPYNPPPYRPEDLNWDGTVDVVDLGIILSFWEGGEELSFTPQPTGVVAGEAFDVAVTMTRQASTVSCYNGTVRLELAENPGGATLSGATTVSAASGVARFEGVMLDQAGSGYVLHAIAEQVNGDTAVVAVSTPFDVVAPVDGTFFTEDFESGWGAWSADNGIWEVGLPTSGPNDCYSGMQCAATVLDGSYPVNTSSLVSPTITLPPIGGSQELHLRFWHWFSFYSSPSGVDAGVVFIQERISPGVWGMSTELARYQNGSGGVWTLPLVDLSAWGGKTVRILFELQGNNTPGASSGWYIDDVSVAAVEASNATPYFDDLEGGIGDWWASNGTWMVGLPTSGPNDCHTLGQCAGTVLGADYPVNRSSLISPTITLPPIGGSQELQLRFWHWFSFYSSPSGVDAGVVFIQERISPGVWGTSTELARYENSSGGVWTFPLVDLSAWGGRTVRVGFELQGSNTPGASSGWYLDDVSIELAN